jgi:hypothetical protein
MTAEAIRKRALLSWRLRLQTSGIYRDPAIPGDPSKIKSGGAAAYAASRPGLAPGSALRLHPCRALSSAPVRSSVDGMGEFVKLVIVADREK